MAKQKLVRFDWAMKNILRNKANYDIVEGFLCALLEDNSLKVLDINESEGNQEDETDKFNRVDVLVKDSQDRNIIIEIQNTRESDYLYRMVYGTSKNISESIESGDKYRNINKVISVSILYFDLGIGDDYIYYGQTEFVGLNTKERINKDSKKVQTLIPKGAKYNQLEIFPEYYLIQVNKYQNIIKKSVDEWVYWFKNEKVKEGSNSKNIKNVEKKLNILKMSPEKRKIYLHYLERLASERDMVETSRLEGKQEAEKKLLPLIEIERNKTLEKEKALEIEQNKTREKEKALEIERNKTLEKEKAFQAERLKVKNQQVQTIKLLRELNLTDKEIAEKLNIPLHELQKTK